MEELTLADYVAIFRRWKKIFFISSMAIFALSAFVAMTWSNYRSTAVIQIEQPEISTNALAPAGTDRADAAQIQADQRISEIQQKVLAPASLVEIITKFNLYDGAREHQQIAAIADTMARKIKIDMVNAQLSGSPSDKGASTIAFKISFDYNNPLLAQQVTDELATRFMDEDLKEKRTETHDTVVFLDTQISALESSMAEQEKKIADFQKENGISRPESLAFNQQAAASATMSLQNLDAQLTNNEGNIGSLRAQLAGLDPYSRVIADGQVMTTPTIQLKSLQAQYASLSAQYGPEYPDVIKVKHQIEALQPQVGMTNTTAQLRSQIADVRTNLKAATKTYGPEHPDVLALKNQLQHLEDQLVSQKAHPTPLNNGVVADADNPVYLQTALQLHAAEEQHSSLLEQRAQLQAQQESYQKAITQNPDAEKELASLSRDYDNAQIRYRELKEKRMAADMDEQMQQDRKGQRLTLINPPQLPSKTTPSRIVILLLGMIASIVGGFASIMLAQILRQSIIGPSLLESIAGAAPLVAIPHIRTNEERERAGQWKSNFIVNGIARRLGRS